MASFVGRKPRGVRGGVTPCLGEGIRRQDHDYVQLRLPRHDLATATATATAAKAAPAR